MGANFRSTLANRPMSDVSLDELVSEFQAELVESLSAFTGEEPTLEIVAEANRVVVRLAQDDEASPGIVPLRAEGDDLIGISFDYKCSWDSTSRYLAIESSSIGVHTWARRRGAPLFRFEYCRSPKTAGIPSSHFHVHAHRDEFTHLLGHGGRGTRIARKRADRSVSDKIPAVSEVHFPTGGPRFRPIIEDVLEMLRFEFGLSATEHWKQRLGEARLKWRKNQVAAVVRDSPAEAIRILNEMPGVEVKVKGEVPGDRADRQTQS